MKIVILGGNGYLGWPTAMHLSTRGHDVVIVDNYLKEKLSGYHNCHPLVRALHMQERSDLFYNATGKRIDYSHIDCTSYRNLRSVLLQIKPDAVVHYAEIPSAPYSMLDYVSARATLDNNLHTTLALAHAVKDVCPDAHIIKLGTLGEYGTPNAPIQEGWMRVTREGDNGQDQSHVFLYPAEPGSLYHVTKVQDTHLLWLYCKTHGLKVTDVMQGPVYGLSTPETEMHPELMTSFYYDALFGTVLNRFVAQAVISHPLTVYGAGGQTKGFINLRDVVWCIDLMCENPPLAGHLRIVNQFTEVHTVMELAQMVQRAADVPVSIKQIPNPREEKEEHFYEVEHHVLSEMGLKPTLMTEEVLADMLRTVSLYGELINSDVMLPKHSWRHSPTST